MAERKVKSLRVRNISVEEMNKHLKFVHNYRKIMYEDIPPVYSQLWARIEDNPVNFKLTYSRGGVTCTYVCRKDGTIKPDGISGAATLKSLGHYTKIPRIENKQGYTSRPFTYINDKYEGIRQYHCYGYDVNKCYRWAMLQPMPDTSVKPRAGTINVGKELGFALDIDEDNFIMKKEGYSNWIFPLIESPFKAFVEHWSKEKDKAKSKGVINSLTGQLKYTNYYLRAAIVSYARQRMESLIDENTLYCNTDSIVSLKERLDLPLSDDKIGYFRKEHDDQSFVYIGSVYQWDFEKPSWKGVSESRFNEKYDLETDEIPDNIMPYDYNYDKKRIVKV